MTGSDTDTDTVLRAVAAAPPLRPPPHPAGERRLDTGDLVADRFAIEALAGQGGMGAVYRARDRETGQPVALKVMRTLAGHLERFALEARVLAELSHPAIVRYVAHGAQADGELFLAMEWLDGETLAQRLDRAPLAVAESVALLRNAAAGLAAAHARGIVHRDVKPSNLLLVGGDPARLKLLDFGIARLRLQPRALTRTGAIVGTAGYMAPEQARGQGDVDARADVFALGCVLFECLAGQPPFSGATVLATLAKVVLEQAPRLRSVRPELPAALDELVARMLAKDREARPADANALLADLDKLGELSGGAPAARGPEAVTADERRLYSVILARPAATDLAHIQSIVRPFSGEVALLADGTLLVTLPARDSATDQAAQAASCALALRAAQPGAPIALATGRAETSGRHPVGPAIDRAEALLVPSSGDSISIDEVTAGLLDARFEVRAEGGTRSLVGERALAGARTLLGRPTPFVGREKELNLLEATLAECVREPVARAVLVTAPAGTGKSRLRYELIERVAQAGEVAVLVARADPTSAGSSLALMRQLVRGAVGLRDGELAADQYGRLRAHLATLTGRQDPELLGELVGAPSTEPSPALRAARNDPRLMAERLRRAFLDWIAGECAVRPLLVVLEDLHWGDAPSVAWLAEALKALAERPLMVLALARPEARAQFAPIWTQEVSLGGLTRRAAERLVHAVLGESVAPEVVSRIVLLADGNAYYLEELIRRVAEGGGGGLPETVLAMAQSRLERLEPDARRVLRAASVFGETCWDGAVAALLGGDTHAPEVADWLRALSRGELLQQRETTKFPGQTEYVFRHGLLREAAYAMLTDADRTAAHRLAGEWLETAGEKEARVVADHFEHGQSPSRAVPWLLLAAKAALDADNFAAAFDLGERGVACGAEGETRGMLHDVQGQACYWSNDVHRAVKLEREAVELLPLGSLGWFNAAGILSMAGMFSSGDAGPTLEMAHRLASLGEVPRPVGAVAIAFNYFELVLFIVGQVDMAVSLAALLERSATLETDHDPIFSAFLSLSRMQVADNKGDLGTMLCEARAGLALLDNVGSNVSKALARNLAAVSLHGTGCCLEELRSLARKGIASQANELDLDWCTVWLARAELLLRNPGVARALLEPVLASRNPMVSMAASASFAQASLADGFPDEAERSARPIAELDTAMIGMTTMAQAVLARLALAHGRPREALQMTERAAAMCNTSDASHVVCSMLRLIRVEALRALGDNEAALSELRAARDRILRLAASLETEPAAREQFLTNLEANANTLALARELLGEG